MDAEALVQSIVDSDLEWDARRALLVKLKKSVRTSLDKERKAHGAQAQKEGVNEAVDAWSRGTFDIDNAPGPRPELVNEVKRLLGLLSFGDCRAHATGSSIAFTLGAWEDTMHYEITDHDRPTDSQWSHCRALGEIHGNWSGDVPEVSTELRDVIESLLSDFEWVFFIYLIGFDRVGIHDNAPWFFFDPD